MYRFYDKTSEEISITYKISDYVILFEDHDFVEYNRVLDILCNHTCKILDELHALDDYGTFILTESIRFLINAFNFQTYYNKLHKNYYSKILQKFHTLGYLTFKEEINPYKLYKKKKFIFKINYNINNENKEIVYYSLKNMRIDFGRYKVDKITQTYPKHSSLDYNFISTIGAC